MQISIGKVQLTGPIPAESVQAFKLSPVSEIQDSKAIGAQDITQFPRGNKKVTITFTIQRERKSAEEAAYFCAAHEMQFPVQDLLTYRTDAGVLYLPNAVAVVTQADFEGATTTHGYRITGGGFKTTPDGASTGGGGPFVPL